MQIHTWPVPNSSGDMNSGLLIQHLHPSSIRGVGNDRPPVIREWTPAHGMPEAHSLRSTRQ